MRIPAVTADQMREVDRLAVEVYGIELVQMMEQAGRNLAELARTLLGGSLSGRRVAVAAGKGNNGGGGLVAARYLSNWGAQAVVHMDREESLAAVPRSRWQTLSGLPVERMHGDDALRRLGAGGDDLVIDALIGYSLHGDPTGWVAEAIEAANASGVTILALDLPSGLDATSGRASAPCVRASATLTLALPKSGLYQHEAAGWTGRLYLADIGIPPALYRRIGLEVGPLFAEASVIPLPSP